ncbi:hypothetical protein C8A00DRAFT_29021 [Chaetomidium leptoderma]|uniref:Uncharacterized protein n=1 Tax=Chaetomidium leptoderma TaxID=669021 RepID=A0AAN6ZZU8_9PEZI|nr:hypothetical protein C8A00DRAFT_29021 [Chaetomidium leptoderma]
MCPQIPIPDSRLEADVTESETDQSQDHADREELALALSNPWRVDPVKLSIPAPPYHPPDNIVLHCDVHMAVLRPVLAGALHEYLGSDAPVESVLGSGNTRTIGDINMHFDGVSVVDREAGFDLETGYWKDKNGREGCGIDAYWDQDDELFIVQWIVYQIDWLVRGVDGTHPPPIVQLKAQVELEDGKVVFQVCEYPEWSWKYPFLRAFEASSFDEATPPQQLPPPHHPTTTRTPAPTPSSHTLFLAKRDLRQQRRSLISSGDFLGVTGVNPYTGAPDIITPPTSSEDAIITTTTNTSSSSQQQQQQQPPPLLTTTPPLTTTTTTNPIAALAQQADEARQVYELARRKRRLQKEEERQSRAEQRKEVVREVVLQRGVRWRREEGGWSSVAEPRLSPILQSPAGSGGGGGGGGGEGKKSSLPSNGGVVVQGQGQGIIGVVVVPERQESFLGMAAAVAAGGVEGCRRSRYMGGKRGVVLVPRQENGQQQTRLVAVGGEGKVLKEGDLRPLRKAMARFCLGPPIPRRRASLRQHAGHLRGPCPERESGSLIAIHMDLRRLRRIPAGRVLELDDSDPAEPWTDSQLHDLTSPDSNGQTNRSLKASSTKSGRGSAREFPFVCTRTTTTTGFEVSQPRCLIDAYPSDATLDGSRDTPPRRQAVMSAAPSQSTLPLSSTATSKSICSGPLGSLSSMQLSVWRNPNSLGLQMATTPTSVQEKLGSLPADTPPPIPPPPPEREAEADNVTTSSSTREITPLAENANESSKPPQGKENYPLTQQQQQPDWAMRKTMRKPSNPNPEDSEAGGRRSSPTSTRTSTYLMTQPLMMATWQDQKAEAIARGAARTAFKHYHDRTRPPMGMTTTRMPRRGPVSAPGPGSRPHGARAAGTTAKAAAKPAAAAGTMPGQSQQGGSKKKGNHKGEVGGVEMQRWMRSAMVMLARVVSAYWQTVSPVFDGDSELRKRVDKAQARRGDVVVCVLAVVFLFLVVSAGVWAVRGIVWAVKLLGELGEVLRTVAGL